MMISQRKTKVVATLGPASSEESVLRKLVQAGMNIARVNCSHGDHAGHAQTIQTLRDVSDDLGMSVSVLLDLQGPKIRCGRFLNGSIEIEKDQEYQLVYGKEQSHDQEIPIDYQDLVHDVKVNQKVLMDDGLLAFKIISMRTNTVMVRALRSGTLKDRKGVNFPDSLLSIPAMTEKDSKDLLFGIARKVDYVALSFVQKPEDIIKVKEMIQALGADTPIIAKIEKLSAVETIDAICEVADGLMVARGDLGVEASLETVPRYQKVILKAARKASKPVIVATQMLESMVTNPKPTFAEVTDVANAVLDGADCVMLSAEVASGDYPVECVSKMVEIIETVEDWNLRGPLRNLRSNLKNTLEFSAQDSKEFLEIHSAVAIAACEAVEAVDAKAIVCLSLTGNIARVISRWRPPVPIIAFSPREDVMRRISIYSGVYGMNNPIFYQTDKLLAELPKLLKELKILHSGDRVVITAGIPISRMSATNMVKIDNIP